VCGVVEAAQDPSCSGVRTRRAMAVLSDIKKANGRDPVACASTSAMAAPWEKATTRHVGMGRAIRSMALRMRW
jgi:hypothetical protein